MFEPPFYRLIVENYVDDHYEVAKLTLGTSEPSVYVINDLINKNWDKLKFYRQSTDEMKISDKRINPKRLQRISRKEVNNGIGTKAQIALKEQSQLEKKASKKKKSEYLKEKKQKNFAIKQQKKAAKHKGH
ncbi:YjdF family protein [Apilactobacillus apinorum]|uniref:YjdF family protein n=1 Tax=Apilactobacillus apinorum TaxID=1218495 RepID=UPI0021E27754|nr:YjdF family protein [Apilactobacillus apinorum]